MTDLIKRDDALAALTLGATMTVLQNRILAIPAVNPAAIREAALREAAAAVSKLADHAVTALAYEHAQACRDEILELIGEKT
jgi:hypothetical protein